ncbi:hypothetical protein QU38_02495, partial [Staphylococcus aureus]
ELKNPLASLRSAVDGMAAVRKKEHRDQLLEIVRDDVLRLDRLITDISEASRLDAQLSRATFEPVDIGTMIQALLDQRERVDFDLGGVGALEGGEERRSDLGGLLALVAGQAQRGGDGAAVVRHEAGRRIDVEGMDLLGSRMRDFLDVHAALGRDDEGDAAGHAVDEERQVEFLGDVGAVGDVEAVD